LIACSEAATKKVAGCETSGSARQKDFARQMTRDDFVSSGFWRVFNAPIYFQTHSRRFTSGYHLHAPSAQMLIPTTEFAEAPQKRQQQFP
jgi:hypothetical protein